MSDVREIPLFPLNTVLFPGMPLPLHIFEPRYKLMIDQCIEQDSPFGVVLIREGQEVGGPAVPYDVGTSAFVTQVERLPDDCMNINAIGYQRFYVRELHHDKPYLIGLVEDFPLSEAGSASVAPAANRLRKRLPAYLEALTRVLDVQFDVNGLPDDPSALALLTAIVLNLPADEKQGLLATPDLVTLLNAEIRLLGRESALLDFMVYQEHRWGEEVTSFSSN